jgi:hypothetical protein
MQSRHPLLPEFTSGFDSGLCGPFGRRPASTARLAFTLAARLPERHVWHTMVALRPPVGGDLLDSVGMGRRGPGGFTSACAVPACRSGCLGPCVRPEGDSGTNHRAACVTDCHLLLASMCVPPVPRGRVIRSSAGRCLDELVRKLPGIEVIA